MTYQAWRKYSGGVRQSGGGFIVPAGGGGGFPTNGILDSFNRADEGPPPSASWTSIVNSVAEDAGLRVSSNELRAVNSNLNSAYLNANYGPNVEGYMTLRNNSTVDRMGFYFRFDPATDNGYSVLARGASPSNTIRVYRVTAGAFNQLGADISQTIAVGDSLGLTMISDTITVYYKVGAGSWTALTTRTDSTYTGAGKLGVAIWDDIDGTVDDFGGGNI